MKIKFTQFRWLVTMLLLVTAMVMPKMAWAEPYDENGFAEDGSYQHATLTTDQHDINGDGTKDEVYEIGNAGQLYWFAALVNGELGDETQNTSANAVLTANITVNKDVLYYDGTLANNYPNFITWTPIGVNGYEGTFDGQGHTISGLYFNNSEGDLVGLFGGNSGTIKNVGVVDSYFYGHFNVGGVCGSNSNGGKITGCYNTGTVSGNDGVGGVCGDNYIATITGCYNTGAVSGETVYVGGVCGCNKAGKITGCYTNNGGVCINEEGTITGDCGEKSDNEFRDGTVCPLLNKALKKVNASVRFYQGANYPEFIKNLPSLVGDVYQISNKEELYAFAQLVNNGETNANAVLTANITVNTDVLKSDGTLNNNGSGFEPWTPIGNAQNSYTGTFDGQGHTISGLYFKDVYASHVGLFSYSSGTIRNVGVIDSYFKGSDYIGGVCGYNHAEGDFSQATIENCYNTGTVSGNFDTVGGVCGSNGGKITGCYNTGTVSGNSNVGGVCGYGTATIENCYNTGSVSGNIYIGGVCGYNHAEGEYSTVTIENCYNTGTVSGYDNVGGVCGYNHAKSEYSTVTIENCYNTGTVSCNGHYAGGVCGYNYAEGEYSTVTIENCYNTGTVSGSGSNVGGVCGANQALDNCTAPITNCYYNSEKYTGNAIGTNDGTVTNVEGKTTAQFMSGEVCYLMNNGITDGTLTWHQNIDMEGATKDPYPVLDNTHGVVYQCSVCTSAYSNTEGAKGAHDYVDVGNGFLTCEACGTKSYQPATLNASNQYEISNAGQLYWFAALVNGDESVCDYDADTNPTGTQQKSAASAKLTADIVVNSGLAEGKTMLESLEYDTASGKVTNGSSFVAWTPMGYYKSDDDYVEYKGTFDGQGHTISGLYFNDSKVESIGLFGSVYEGYVKNVGVVDSYFCGNAWVGGVCGWAGNSRIENCYNEGTVYGSDDRTGGVCGDVSMSTIENCYNEGTVFCLDGDAGGVCGDVVDGTIINCHNSGSVSGGCYVGGVCGMVNICDTDKSYMINCYNTGDVKGVGTSVSLTTGGVCGLFNRSIYLNCYNTGTVSATAAEVGPVLGETFYSYCNNCYYLEGCNAEGTSFTNEFGTKMSSATFGSGEVAYLLSQGSTVVDKNTSTYYSGASWGQQLGSDDYPVLSDYKVIKAAEGDNKTYWATFSNQSSDMDLSGLTVYTAKVSEGILTLTPCTDHIVAKGEGVLVKGNSEYLNALMLNDKTETPEANNDLVATPAEPTVINATTGHVLYRLTYNNVSAKEGLGFYLSLVKDGNNNVIENSVGSQLKATPGKAYLKVSTEAATTPATAALARSFVFPGDDETTGIGEIVIEGDAGISGSANANGRIYNLQGQQVTAPVKGLYIKNNKKVIIK